MNRDDLLNRICPTSMISNCRNCDDCSRLLSKMFDEYDKYVIEQYKANTRIKDTIREIHDNVAQEMYCKGIDDLCNEMSTYRRYDEYGNVIDLLEIAKKVKENK